jgi:hypothetical protein
MVGFVADQAHNSYATGDVSGNQYIGGFTSSCNGSMTNCYSTGLVVGITDVGGLLSTGSGTITDCFWDVNTSNMPTSAGGTGKTTSEMMIDTTFISAGWDFSSTWKMCAGITYPKLMWENYGGGEGTPESPCLICRPEEMHAIGKHIEDWDKHFKLMEDIDMIAYTGTDYSPIGRLYERPAAFFDGSFDGNGHSISNFSYKSPDKIFAGLFGVVSYSQDANVVIKDLTVIDPNVDVGTGGDAGAIVGMWFRDGLMSNCRVIGGRIKGASDIGGLVGYNMNCRISNCFSSSDVIATAGLSSAGGLIGISGGGPISGCSSAGTVTANNGVGGLIGFTQIDANVVNCYSIATVDGNELVGGLIGYASADVNNSYAAGPVTGLGTYVGGLIGGVLSSSITNSFWDVNTSGLPGPWAGTGLSTSEMQDPNTFISAGWDFVGEGDNGNEDIWRLCEPDVSYPFFARDSMNGDFTCPDGVDFLDYAHFAMRWMQIDCGDCDRADMTGDGDVNGKDLRLFCDLWLTGM